MNFTSIKLLLLHDSVGVFVSVFVCVGICVIDKVTVVCFDSSVVYSVITVPSSSRFRLSKGLSRDGVVLVLLT